MKSKVLMMALVMLAIIPFILNSCKGKSRTPPEDKQGEYAEIAPGQEDMLVAEPAQTVATEMIPPTAAAPIAPQKSVVKSPQADRNKDIQRALTNAGFYSAAIDGKIGPRTKKAIEEFQKAKGLKADGKVGPKTWMELEKYLSR
jgi:peptidoglycan hydrolase-like protein with peptidoglycan-binding domain